MRPTDRSSTIAPEWLAHRYDPVHDAIHLIRADRAERRRVPFLIDANLPGHDAPVVALRLAARNASPPDVPAHFIFHSAYCCSTLLANMLDQPGVASSFKEPLILNDLVGWRHRAAAGGDFEPVLDDVLRVLARPFAPDEAVIVKPSNVVNGLATTMMTMRPDARCILLHAPLEVYLGSIATKGMWGRLWVRELLAKRLLDGPIDLGFDPEDYLLQTDLQVAAVGWLAQHQLFVRMARRWPRRARLLDSERLLAQPHCVLSAIARMFDLPITPPLIDDILSSDAFARNAKDGEKFDQAARIAGQKSAADIYGDEITKVAQWARAVADSAGLDLIASDTRLLIPD